MKTLSSKQIAALQKKYPDWKLNKPETKLTATLKFQKHVEALVFLARLTVHAEVLNHHPDVLYSYKQLKITTTTHDAEGLTKLDKELTERIEHLRSQAGD